MLIQQPKIAKVVQDDMCIACGACIYACPEKIVEPTYSEIRGAHEVKITEVNKCADCSAPCDRVCPSIEVNFTKLLNKNQNNTIAIERSGNIESIYLGYSPEHRFNGVSSSGGIIRSFINNSVKIGQPVICLGTAGENYEPIIVERLADLEKIPGSIYHGVSFIKCIELLKNIQKSCLLIATPCQLEGIYKYIQEIEPNLRNKIGLTVGLICGWMYSDHALKAFSNYKNIQGKIVDAGYRGEDKVGLLKIKTDHQEYSYNRRQFNTIQEFIDYQASFSSGMNRLRCRVCENHLNILADLAVGDAWLERKQDEKLSIIVTRTITGDRALSALISQDNLVLEQGLYLDIEESQSPNLVYSYVARKMSSFLQKIDIITPQFIFSDSDHKIPLNFNNFWEFKFEMLIRKIIRSSQYKLYRKLYLTKKIIQSIYRKFKIK